MPFVGLNGRSVVYPRGKILGGSSCINGIVWTRGSKDDFDRFARVTGDDGWSWDSLQPYMLGVGHVIILLMSPLEVAEPILKVEQLVPTSDGRDTDGELVASIHGTSGLVGISSQNVLTDIDGRVINTTSELSEFPFNEDMNSGNTIGIGEYFCTQCLFPRM